MREFIAGKNDGGQRVDRFLSKLLPHLPPSMLAKFIRKKKIRLNGKHPAPSDRISEGDRLCVYINDELFSPPEEKAAFRLVSPNLDGIVYEDENLVLVNKPQGLLVHADEGGSPDTLIARIQSYLYAKGEWDPQSENAFAPALCNRIDRNTSGIVIAAKNAAALRELGRLIKEREITKYYLCVTEGLPPAKQGVLTGYILRNPEKKTVTVLDSPAPGAKYAETAYRLLAQKDGQALLECRLVTGRTHQIRACLARAGFPIRGDGKYGRGNGRQALISYRLDFLPMENSGMFEYLKGRSFKVDAPAFEKEFGCKI